MPTRAWGAQERAVQISDFRFYQISDVTELQGGLKNREAEYRLHISDAKASEKWAWEALEISDNLLGDYML